jgi:YD repeat-containing protein
VPPDQRVLRFDAAGRLVSVKNARGFGVTLAYTNDGILRSVTDASSRVVVFDSRADLKLITKITMPDKRYVQFDYEGNRLLKVQDARLYTYSFQYNATGRLESMFDAKGNRQFYNEYDAASRVLRQTDAENKLTTFAWDPVKQQTTTTDPDEVAVVDGYRDNVLLWSRDRNNDIVNTRYDGKLQKNLVIDPKGNQEETTFDAAGNPHTRTAPEPFSFTQVSEFDKQNNLRNYTDGRGKKWVYEYNEFNELTSQRDPTQKDGYSYVYDDRAWSRPAPTRGTRSPSTSTTRTATALRRSRRPVAAPIWSTTTRAG